MQALNNFVVVMQDEQTETTTESGLILTTDINTGHKPGIVIGVGPDVENISPGQKVVLDWTKAKPFSMDGQQLAAVKSEDIFAIFE